MLSLSIQTAEGAWEYLEFRANARVNIVTVNPAFDQSVVGRAFSFPFTLPPTARNLAMLRYFSRMDARYRENEFPARLYVGGSVFEVGVLTITEVTNSDIEATFSNKERRLIDYFSKLKIRDLMETIDIPQEISVPAWTWHLLGGLHTFRIQINEEEFAAGPLPADVAGALLVAAINEKFPGVATYDSGGDFLFLAPGWDFDPFVVRSCRDWGMEIGNFTTFGKAREENFRAWVTDQRDTPPDWGAFPLMLWRKFYRFNSGESAARRGLNAGGINSIVGTPGIGYAASENRPGLQPVWSYMYVPMVRMKYVLDQIMDAVPELTGWVGTIYEEDDTAALLIFNNYALDAVRQDYYPDNDIDELLPDKYLNCHQTQVNLSQHVPALTGLEAIERFCAVRNLYIVTDGGSSVQFKRRIDQIIDAPRDWRAFLQNERRLQVKPKQGVGLKYVDEPLEAYEDETQLQPYGASGGLQTEITGTVFDTSYGGSGGGNFHVCITDMPGRSDEWKEGGGEDAVMRFLFDRGLVDPDGDDNLRYWRCSHTDLDVDGVTPVGDYTLEIQGDSGIYKRFWKGWLELQDRPTGDLYFVLPAEEITRMARWQNARVKIYHPDGDVTLVVKSLEFEVTLTAIGVVKAVVVIQ